MASSNKSVTSPERALRASGRLSVIVPTLPEISTSTCIDTSSPWICQLFASAFGALTRSEWEQGR
jgi:hypothetical protein